LGLPPQPRSHATRRPQHGAARMSRDINPLQHGRFAGDAVPARRPGRNRAAISLCETDGTRLEMSARCGVPRMSRVECDQHAVQRGSLVPLPGHAARSWDQALRAVPDVPRRAGLGKAGVSLDWVIHGPLHLQPSPRFRTFLLKSAEIAGFGQVRY